MNGLKIFEINWKEQGEKEWVAARTNIEALQVLCALNGFDIDDFDWADEVIELPESKWHEERVRNIDYDPELPDDWKEMTFAEYMKTCIEPCVIAGSMYD